LDSRNEYQEHDNKIKLSRKKHMNTNLINPLLESWKINKMITVNSPINEQTILLLEKWCHHNVCNIQSKLGGQAVLGFLISDIDEYLWCVPHSIWKNQNSEFIDVTFHDNQIRYFAPVVSYNPKEILFLLQHEYKFYKDISKGIDWIMPSRPIKNLTSTEMVSINFSSLIFKRNYPITETDSWDDYLDELNDEI
jgi:hypothetical protein